MFFPGAGQRPIDTVRRAQGDSGKQKTAERPKLEIPDIIKKEGIEGSVKIVIDIDETGNVTDTRLVKGLQPDADKACLLSWRTAVFSPAEQNGERVAISNFPRRCRFQAL